MAKFYINLYYFLLCIIRFSLQAVILICANLYYFSLNDLLVIGLVHQKWSLSVIHAQFVLFITPINLFIMGF